MPNPCSDFPYERAFEKSIQENDDKNYSKRVNPALLRDADQKDKSHSNLTPRQYIVTQLVASKMELRQNQSDEYINAKIDVYKKIADKILKDC